MKDETAPGLDRPAVMDGMIRRLPRIDVQLLQKPAKANPRTLVPDADANGAILIVHAQGDHGAFETRIGHSRHR